MKTKFATKVSLIIIYTVFVATMNVGEERKTRLCVHFNSNQRQTQTPSSGLRKPSKEEGRQKARPSVCVRRSPRVFFFFFFFCFRVRRTNGGWFSESSMSVELTAIDRRFGLFANFRCSHGKASCLWQSVILILHEVVYCFALVCLYPNFALLSEAA